jgi:FkbM family methyltransferase
MTWKARAWQSFLRSIRANPASFPARFLARYASELQSACSNDGCFDPVKNGEYLILERLSTLWRGQQDVVLLDVGANRGDWSCQARELFPNAKIIALEPVVDNFVELSSRSFKHKATLHQCGLSDSDLPAVLYFSPGQGHLASSHSGLLRHHGLELKALSACMRIGDVFLETHNYRHVQLAKIDVEGHEYRVLRGLQNSLRTGKIDCLQFEYSQGYVDQRAYLRDVFDLLAEAGYIVGRIHPDGARFLDYSYDMENFRYANFVAVRRCLRDVIACVAAPF